MHPPLLCSKTFAVLLELLCPTHSVGLIMGDQHKLSVVKNLQLFMKVWSLNSLITASNKKER